MSMLPKLTVQEANRVLDMLLERFEKDPSLFKHNQGDKIIAEIKETKRDVKISNVGVGVYVTIVDKDPPFNFTLFTVQEPENFFAFKERGLYKQLVSKIDKLAKLIKDKDIPPRDSILYNTFPEYIDGFINEGDK